MSMAVCLACGVRKHGALVPCPGCGHSPASLDDRARHLLICEGATPEDLERLGALIAQGGAPPDPDPVALEETRALLRQATPLRVAGFALVAGGVPLLLLLGTLVVVAWLVAMV